MRISPLRDLLAKRGAKFEDWSGAETATEFTSFEREYKAVREAVGITDFSFTTRFKVPEDGLDMLESYAAGSISGIRFGRVSHTLAASEEGYIESDLYVANDDEELIVMGESLIDDEATNNILRGLGSAEAGLLSIQDSTALIGLDGLNAWAVAKDLFGLDVLGLPYLSIETYELDGSEIKLIRGGKTSEFGYLFLVPADKATQIWERIEEAGKPYGIEPVGAKTHLGLRLDGRFFSIRAEGAKVRDPLPLGLQWMIDLDGDDFRGKEAIMKRRSDGLGKKIIGVVPGDAGTPIEIGETVHHQGATIAEIVAATESPALGHRIGLALFDYEFAYSGLTFDNKDKQKIKTVSMPPFTPKSLTVKLDEM